MLTESDPKAVIAIYETHLEAESAVEELQRAGFDMKKLSVVGKDYHLWATKPTELNDHDLGAANPAPAS